MPISIIAEIGCNHMGDFGIAKKMIVTAAHFCNVHAVKFQKRNNRELLAPGQYDAPHPVPENAYGDTYGAHREALEFTRDQHAELKALCEREGVVYSCSVWDMTSAREIASLAPAFIKIPSACNLNYPMQRFLCREYPGQIHLSAGMTTRAELEEIVAFYEEHGRAKDLVLYACTSGYPVPAEDVCLLEIGRLRDLYAGRVRAIGFSGHHKGIALDIAAITLGASWVERHFTMDRTWRGTDHAASLEPDGLRRLCRDVSSLEKALARKADDILPIEAAQRAKLKRSDWND